MAPIRTIVPGRALAPVPGAMHLTPATAGLVPNKRGCTTCADALIADWRDAEKIAAAWMVSLGFSTANATPGGADAGGRRSGPKIAIAQVKLSCDQ